MTADTSPIEPVVAIVTVTFNAENVIEDFLASLLQQTRQDWVLIVVDNASADRTLAYLEAVRGDPRVEIIACDSNTGAATGNNIGLERALALRPTRILMTNNDVIFGPAVIANLLAAKDSVAAGAVSATLFYDGASRKIWYDGGRITTRTAVRCVHETPKAGDRLDRPAVYETDYAPTTFLLFDTKAIESIGRLDDQYFAYWEDADYLWRLKKAGFGIWVSRDVHVVHKVGQSSGGSGSGYSNRQYYKNQMLFTKKHFSSAKLALTATMSIGRIIARTLLKKDSFATAGIKLSGLAEGLFRIKPVAKTASSWQPINTSISGVPNR